jgi:hypothetical protein
MDCGDSWDVVNIVFLYMRLAEERQDQEAECRIKVNSAAITPTNQRPFHRRGPHEEARAAAVPRWR